MTLSELIKDLIDARSIAGNAEVMMLAANVRYEIKSVVATPGPDRYIVFVTDDAP